MSKDEAFADASTIADLSSWTITWVDAGDLAGIGHPEAVGLTDAFTNTIWGSSTMSPCFKHSRASPPSRATRRWRARS